MAVAIDYLVDSATADPSRFNIPSFSLAPDGNVDGYISIARGVHSFVARRAGDASLTSSVYTNSRSVPYLPRQFLSAGTYYTTVVAGVIPATGGIPFYAVYFTVLVDDPFPGPTIGDVAQARFHVINAAPFASSDGNGATVNVYLTPGSTVPSDVATQYVRLGTANYRDKSPDFNVDPGTYVVTLVANGQIVAQQSIVFAAGEVRTLVLQSTASGTPGTGNHVLHNILDHQY
jgi:hypothetical protein